MKHKTSFVIVYWWLLLLLLGGVLLLCFAEKEARISESENRMLSGFPELSAENLRSGDFFLGIESYLSDGVWGRDAIVGVSESILGLFCANTDEEADMLNDAEMADELLGNTPEQSADVSRETPEEPSADQAPETVSAAEELTKYGLWRIREDGAYVPVRVTGEEDIVLVARMLNDFQNALPEGGSVFYANVPMTSTALTSRKSYAGWYENIDTALEAHISEGIHILNTPAILSEALWAGEPVYFTSDHHWTPLAANMVVTFCMDILGIPAVPYAEYDYTVNRFADAAAGTADDLELMHPLQSAQGNSMPRGQQGEQRVLINYDSPAYRAYLGGDSSVWMRYKTGFVTGRKALVIGDSFCNAFVPYLLPYYDEVHKIDARYYETAKNGGTMAQLMEQYGIDDVYIILSEANGVSSPTSKSKLGRALHGT